MDGIHQSSDVSVACLTRVYRGELPYLRSWLLHYKKIGVSHFYLIHTRNDAWAEGRLLSIIDSCDVPFTFFRSERHLHPNDCFNGFVGQFKEHYLLHVDVDEFLLLPGRDTIQVYIQTFPAQYYRFFWVTCPYDGDGQPQRLAGCSRYRGHKSMALISLVRSIAPHTMSCDGAFVTHDDTNLLHYWGRSFTDILIKCLHGGDLGPPKSTSLHEVMSDVRLGRLPNRLKMLALVSRRATADTMRPNFVERDRAVEDVLIGTLPSRQRSQLLELYGRYRDALTEEVVGASLATSLINYVPQMP